MRTREIRAFRRDLRTFSRILARQVEICCSADVTVAQCHALLALEESGPVPNFELASLLQIDASTLSRTVDQLVGKGLVVRQPHPADRRRTMLELSDRGAEVAATIHESADALYRSILGDVPGRRRREILQGFAQLVETFRKWGSGRSGDSRCSFPEGMAEDDG